MGQELRHKKNPNDQKTKTKKKGSKETWGGAKDKTLIPVAIGNLIPTP